MERRHLVCELAIIFILIVFLGIRAEIPILQQAPTPMGPWSKSTVGMVTEMDFSSYSVKVPVSADQMFFRLFFPQGGPPLQAGQIVWENGTMVVNYSRPRHEMVLVEGGTFLMGDEWGDGEEDELPLQEVTVKSFYMGKYEVTNGLMQEVLQWAFDTGKVTVDWSSVRSATGDVKELFDLNEFACQISWNDSEFSVDSGMSDYPVAGLTWYMAAAFCNYLSEMEGRNPCYNMWNWKCDWTANGYRLPLEAEWEYAAKGGIHGQMTKFSGSDNLDEVGWYWENSANPENPIFDENGSHAVGLKKANDLGLHDMSGNLLEWCQDNILRGGGWSDYDAWCRVPYRRLHNITRSNHLWGFRIVRTIPDHENENVNVNVNHE